jgi:pyruvate dehydrogenase (quinone)
VNVERLIELFGQAFDRRDLETELIGDQRFRLAQCELNADFHLRRSGAALPQHPYGMRDTMLAQFHCHSDETALWVPGNICRHCAFRHEPFGFQRDRAIGCRNLQVLGRRAPTVLGVTGSARPTLKLLLDQVASKTNTQFWDKVTQERQKWDEMLDKQADPARSKDRIHPQAVARAVSDLAKPDAVFALDTGLNTLWSGNWIRQSGSQRIIGSFNNGAVGTALGQANGVQALDRSRQVIALCGDGGFNMLMGEFLTAVHHKLPVKVVIYNNSAFGLITLEAESVGLPPFREGIEFPNPDFAALARACGGHGFTASKPGELKAALTEAFAIDGPAIVDAVVVSNELPNLPHLDLDMIEHFALAKIKEAVLAVTGR